MQLFLLALEPSYKFGWKSGAKNLMMTSCGTGSRRPSIAGAHLPRLPPGLRGVHALRAMVYDTQVQGVMMMQALSEPQPPLAHQFRNWRSARRLRERDPAAGLSAR